MSNTTVVVDIEDEPIGIPPVDPATLPETRHGTGPRRHNLRRFLAALEAGAPIPTQVRLHGRLSFEYHVDLDNPRRDLVRDAGNAARALGIEVRPARSRVEGHRGQTVEVWRWSAPYPGPETSAFVILDEPATETPEGGEPA